MIQDDEASYFAEIWTRQTPPELTRLILRNERLWEHDLTQLPGFADALSDELNAMLANGAYATLTTFLTEKRLNY